MQWRLYRGCCEGKAPSGCWAMAGVLPHWSVNKTKFSLSPPETPHKWHLTNSLVLCIIQQWPYQIFFFFFQTCTEELFFSQKRNTIFLRSLFKTYSSPPFNPHSEIIKFPVGFAVKMRKRQGSTLIWESKKHLRESHNKNNWLLSQLPQIKKF